MIRIADIIGGSGEDKQDKEKKKPDIHKDVNPPTNIELVKIQQENSPSLTQPLEDPDERQAPTLMELSKSMLDKVKLESQKESQDLYSNLVNNLREVCRSLNSGENPNLEAINNNLDALIDQIALGNEDFLIISNKSYLEDYIYYHMVNVTILAIILGKQMGYNKTKLQDLALGSILHDIGILTFVDIINSPAKISDKDYEQIKRHPVLGVEILEKQKGLPTQVLSIILQHHERLDGSGYPFGLKADKIDELAQIVSVVNVYEALTHKRPFRENTLNDQAIRLMVERKYALNPRILKLFIETISIYPLHSWVKLSSGEIAKVIGVNKASFLKPIIRIYFDRQGKRLEVERNIDLSKQPNIYVKEQILPETIEPKLK